MVARLPAAKEKFPEVSKTLRNQRFSQFRHKDEVAEGREVPGSNRSARITEGAASAVRNDSGVLFREGSRCCWRKAKKKGPQGRAARRRRRAGCPECQPWHARANAHAPRGRARGIIPPAVRARRKARCRARWNHTEKTRFRAKVALGAFQAAPSTPWDHPDPPGPPGDRPIGL